MQKPGACLTLIRDVVVRPPAPTSTDISRYLDAAQNYIYAGSADNATYSLDQLVKAWSAVEPISVIGDVFIKLCRGLSCEFKHDDVNAAVHYESCMSLFDKLPSSHPDKAIPIGCLAATLYHQGHYSEALDKYKMALDIRRTALGSQHVDYAVTLHNIGIVKATMGNTEDGMKNVYDAMTTFEACFGIRHIRYMAAYRNWTRMKELQQFSRDLPAPPVKVAKKKKVVSKNGKK